MSEQKRSNKTNAKKRSIALALSKSVMYALLAICAASYYFGLIGMEYLLISCTCYCILAVNQH